MRHCVQDSLVNLGSFTEHIAIAKIYFQRVSEEVKLSAGSILILFEGHL